MNHQDIIPQSAAHLQACFPVKTWTLSPDIPSVWLKVGQAAKPADAVSG